MLAFGLLRNLDMIYTVQDVTSVLPKGEKNGIFCDSLEILFSNNSWISYNYVWHSVFPQASSNCAEVGMANSPWKRGMRIKSPFAGPPSGGEWLWQQTGLRMSLLAKRVVARSPKELRWHSSLSPFFSSSVSCYLNTLLLHPFDKHPIYLGFKSARLHEGMLSFSFILGTYRSWLCCFYF